MSGNLESNDQKPSQQMESADLTSHGFSQADQQEVFKRIAQSNRSDVGGLDLDTTDSGNTDQNHRRIEQPHNWYENSKRSYTMPSEALITGSIRPMLQSGWRKLNA
ncbi:MAG: hypothetical protein K2X27_14045 [Candidatus Obscuribacterales bacterium]|nr:hypothetical protein [Candidatus Obscuribacterales bacterium]